MRENGDPTARHRPQVPVGRGRSIATSSTSGNGYIFPRCVEFLRRQNWEKKKKNKMVALVLLHLWARVAATVTSFTSPLSTCGPVDHGVCMNAAKPILRIVKDSVDPGACCALCLNMTACAAWNINSEMKQCFLRATGVPTNPGAKCISQQLRPNPPSPPPAPSDQRPRFHFAPTQDFTNDVQGCFYDAVHNLYHMGFA